MKRGVKFNHITLLLMVICFLFSCNDNCNCERHFIKKGFTGEVKILYNKEDGLKEFDTNGCLVYRINENGLYKSSHSFEECNRYEKGMFKCFEIISEDSVSEIPIFGIDYYWDTSSQIQNRYIFLGSAGYENLTGNDPNYFSEYYIDSAKKYKNYWW